MKIYKFINSNICTMIILFAFYSFLGWTCEVLYAYSLHHHFVNRGFFTGPFCTIYGFGFLMIYLFLNKFKNKIYSLFIFSILFTSALELITGWALDTLFHIRYWDYTSYPLNIKGYICFYFSLIWGIGSIIVIKILNPVISFLISLIPSTKLTSICFLILFYFIGDLIMSSYKLTFVKIFLENIYWLLSCIISLTFHQYYFYKPLIKDKLHWRLLISFNKI